MVKAPEYLFLFFTLIMLLISPACQAEVKGPIKKPAVAGAFYPASSKELKTSINGFLSKAEKYPANSEAKLRALVSPHAGYVYSGQVAAWGYKNLHGKKVSTVVLIGPAHREAFNGAAVYAEGSFSTPLGEVPVDKELAAALVSKDEDVHYYTKPFEKEHSLEVQIPFLQTVLKDFKILPILVGSPTRKSYDKIVDTISDRMKEDGTVFLVASTDLSHYHDYDAAEDMDEKLIGLLRRISVREVEQNLRLKDVEMCGAYAVIYTMEIARRLGALTAVKYKYANSGDVPIGDRARVVGYLSMGFYQSPISTGEKKQLLRLARDTIETFVKEKKLPDAVVDNPRFLTDSATFVTINRNGRLRGCIGNIEPSMPLYKSVTYNAVAASSKDPRFRPLSPEELKDIEVEISILSPLVPVGDTEKIEVGRHGLFIVKDGKSGLLLPQVPMEFGWSRQEFLRQVSIKAGLPPGAWMDKDAKLMSFTAEVFSEKHL